MIDKTTRDKLVEENYEHAMRQTQYFEHMIPDVWDRQSFAAEALIRAVETYDPSRGVTIKTYITKCVQRKMQSEGRNAKRAKRRQPITIPLDKPVRSRGGDALSIHDIIPSKEKPPLEQIVYIEDVARLQKALNNLPSQMQDVIFARYINNPSITQREYAMRHNKNQRWASRLESVSLSRCKVNYLLNSAK